MKFKLKIKENFYIIGGEAMNTYKEQKIIRTIYTDLNGDGVKEKVVLAGLPVEKDCNYVESLALIIESESNEKK